MLNIFINLLIGVLVIVSALMVLIVLMQRPKNEGLGASFGSGMTQDLFGAQTTSVLQKFTVYLGGAFFALCLLLTVLYAKQSVGKSAVNKGLEAVAKAQAAETAKAAPGPSASASATPGASAAAVPVEVAKPVPSASAAPSAASASPAGSVTAPSATPSK